MIKTFFLLLIAVVLPAIWTYTIAYGWQRRSPLFNGLMIAGVSIYCICALMGIRAGLLNRKKQP